jgi:hypothetical protein
VGLPADPPVSMGSSNGEVRMMSPARPAATLPFF